MKTKSILLILALSLSLVGCGGGGDSTPYDCSINNVIETTDNGDTVEYKITKNLCNNVTSYSTINNELASVTYSDADILHVAEFPREGVRKVTRYNPENNKKILEINYEVWNNYIETVAYLEDGGVNYNSYTAEDPEYLEYLLNSSPIVAKLSIGQATQSATFN